mgnify:CR=1 FL=1
MSFTVEKLEKNMAKITIEVPVEEFEKAVEKAYQKNKGSLQIQGFRKGKAPRKMIEQMYGKEVFFEDAANIIIPEVYEKVYDECEEEIVSSPVINVTQIEAGKPFIFTAEVASTVNEILLINYQIENETNKLKKMELIYELLEMIRATLFRQAMFAEFEKIIHEKIEKSEMLSSEDLCDIYYELNKKWQ